jgi:ABC-type lipoprotein export system ATPase subunit
MILTISNNHQVLKDSEPLSLPNFVVITGANGSGKSQLLHQIVSVYDGNEERRTLVDDNNSSFQSIEGVFPSSLEERIMYMPPHSGGLKTFQNHLLFARALDIFQELNPKVSLESYDNFEYISTNLNLTVSSPNGPRSILPQELSIIIAVAKNSLKRFKDLEHYDFVIYYPISNSELFGVNLALLFKQYALKKKHYPDQIKDQIEPWLLFNDILKKANLLYTISYPDLMTDENEFSVSLKNKENQIIQFSSLSSGERAIMNLIFALYNSNAENLNRVTNFPDLILFDEPDASLHPALIPYLLDVLENIFVEKHKIKVVITTHSPSTIALAPELSIYAMENGILKKTKKNEAIKLLTEGLVSLSILYENKKQVFVEAKFDMMFYSNLFDILKYKYLNKDILLSFMPSGNDNEAGSTRVIQYTELLTKNGNLNVCGLLDWDLGNNKETERIKVLGKDLRYAIENYIFDPVFLGIFLLYERDKFAEKIGFSKADTTNSILDINNQELQRIINLVIDCVKNSVTRLDEIEEESKALKEKALICVSTKTDIFSITLLNDFIIELPEWYLQLHGHTLENVCKKAFPTLSAKKYNQEHYSLKMDIVEKSIRSFPSFLPKDIVDTFTKLQGIPNS